MTALQQLIMFIHLHKHKSCNNTPLYNKWLMGIDMEVYVRYSKRYINDVKLECLDIANVTVNLRGSGHFTAFLKETEKICPWPVIYIENVASDRFGVFFVKQGYTVKIIGEGPPCYYKVLGMTDESHCNRYKGKDLKPGDLFSTCGPDYWDNYKIRQSVGERVYIRTECPAEYAEDENADVFKITIVVNELNSMLDTAKINKDISLLLDALEQMVDVVRLCSMQPEALEKFRKVRDLLTLRC